MTGGDPITARFLYKDVFTYQPQFKLFLIGNYRPKLTAVNEAIRRRMQLIPFTVTIPEKERDGRLHYKLMTEAEQILTWAISGCLDYQTQGLNPPAAVTKATEDYLNTEDAIAQWLEECCEWEPNTFTSARDLKASWTAWAITANERVGSASDLKHSLYEHAGNHPLTDGVVRINGKPTRGYTGIRVLPKEDGKAKKKRFADSFLTDVEEMD